MEPIAECSRTVLWWSRLRVVRREARLRKAPHPAFGHLPPGGEGSDASRVRTEAISPLLRDRLWGTATAQSRGRGGGGGTSGDRHRRGDRRESAADSRPVAKASTICREKKVRTPCPSAIQCPLIYGEQVPMGIGPELDVIWTGIGPNQPFFRCHTAPLPWP